MTKTNIYFICVPCGLFGLILTFACLNANIIQQPFSKEQTVFANIEGVTYEIHVVPSFKLKTASAQSTAGRSGIEDILFHWNPIFLVWIMLIVLLMTICSFSFPAFFLVLKSIAAEFQLGKKTIWLAIATTAGFISVMVIIFLTTSGNYKPAQIVGDFHILLKHKAIMYVISTSPIFLISPLIMTFVIIPFSADRLEFQGFSQPSVEKVLTRYFKLNTILQNSLYVLAITVVLSLICASALGEAIKATITFVEIDIFPKAISYVYGLFYTLFLGILYVPSQLILNIQYKQMKESIAGNNVSGPWLDSIYKESEGHSTIWDKAKLVLTIFSPLLSSLIPDTVFK